MRSSSVLFALSSLLLLVQGCPIPNSKSVAQTPSEQFQADGRHPDTLDIDLGSGNKFNLQLLNDTEQSKSFVVYKVVSGTNVGKDDTATAITPLFNGTRVLSDLSKKTDLSGDGRQIAAGEDADSKAQFLVFKGPLGVILDQTDKFQKEFGNIPAGANRTELSEKCREMAVAATLIVFKTAEELKGQGVLMTRLNPENGRWNADATAVELVGSGSRNQINFEGEERRNHVREPYRDLCSKFGLDPTPTKDELARDREASLKTEPAEDNGQ